MKDPTSSEILSLGMSKKYDWKQGFGISASRVISSSDYDKKGCDDWCEIHIATIEPTITNIYFSHRGCLLSRACINAIIASIENKTQEEALDILFAFRQMLTSSKVPPELPSRLQLFHKFSKFPSRRGCMLLGCNLIVQELNESRDKK